MDKAEAETFVEKPGFLNKRQKLGRTEVSLLSLNFNDTAPAPGFTQVDVNLEDAYFAFLNGHVSQSDLEGVSNVA